MPPVSFEDTSKQGQHVLECLEEFQATLARIRSDVEALVEENVTLRKIQLEEPVRSCCRSARSPSAEAQESVDATQSPQPTPPEQDGTDISVVPCGQPPALFIPEPEQSPSMRPKSCVRPKISTQISDELARAGIDSESVCDRTASRVSRASRKSHRHTEEVMLCAEWTQGRRPWATVTLRLGTMGPQTTSSCAKHALGSSSHSLRAGEAVLEKGFMQFFIARPTCARRIFWDVASFLFMSYDMVIIPLAAFPLSRTRFSNTMDWTTTVFWTTDICLSFLVGYNNMGMIEMRPKQIAKRYLRSWFPIDVTIVAVDWCLRVVDVEGSDVDMMGVLRIGKTLRIARILRAFRLIRIIKVMTLLAELSDFIHSESILTAFNIMKMVLAIGVINHFIACAWYALAEFQRTSTEQMTWTRYLESVTFDYWVTLPNGATGLSPFYTYTTAMHWSLTQFTPASMEVIPRNAGERTMNILVVLFALVAFSSFVSSITNAMTHLRQINEAATREQELVRRYITDNHVSMELGNRIYCFLRQLGHLQKKRVHEKDIPGFSMMPETLRAQLRSEVFTPVLTPHPFFYGLLDSDPAGLAVICHHAMEEHSAFASEEVFPAGAVASKMFFVVAGSFRYYFTHEKNFLEVKPPSFACEMPLWLKWEHVGRLVSFNCSEMVVLRGEDFRQVCHRLDTDVFEGCRKYAEAFADALSTSLLARQPVDDLWFDFDRVHDMTYEAFMDLDTDEDVTVDRQSFFSIAGGRTTRKHQSRQLRHMTLMKGRSASRSAFTGRRNLYFWFEYRRVYLFMLLDKLLNKRMPFQKRAPSFEE